MKLNLEQVQIGLFNYVDNEIGRKAVGIQKFMTYFGMSAFKGKLVQTILKLKENPIVGQLDIFDDNNNINIDVLYNYAKEAIQHSGQFTFMGIIFNETDIDKVYNYLKQTDVQ